MAYDSERKKFTKEHIWYVEIEVDGTTIRFCEDIAPLPRVLNANPYLSSPPSVAPSQIDLDGGIGVRAKCTVNIGEFLDETVYGTLANPVRFWSRWRAENPYYVGQRISVFSGYINNGLFDASNFVQRDYIIETFSQGASGVTFTGKDPLKLASNERAKAPRESRGSLLTDITDVATTFDLQPSGIGDAEYPASNFYIRIGEEVLLCTSRTSDTLTVTRNHFNTEVSAHSEGDTVQLCLYYDSAAVHEIDYDLLTNYANVATSYIDYQSWQAESAAAFITSYTALITEPTGVQELLKEFAQSAPHYLYYDERFNQIQFKALRPPPSDALTINYDQNIIANSTRVTDKQDMRVSTVVFRFGIINPAKDLDEAANYRVIYVREDTDSVTNNDGQRAYKTVNSRWVPADNQTAAVLMAARYGRRFAIAPRQVGFAVDAGDADFWVGDDIRVQSDLIEQSGGGFPYLNYQVLSAGENDKNFTYTALEHTYADALPQDEDIEDPNVRLIYIASEVLNLRDDTGTARNLREYYEGVYGTGPLDAGLDIRFIFEANAVAGSDSELTYAVETGAWPELTTPILIINKGLIVGKGGAGGAAGVAGGNGGPALRLQANIRLNNLRVIGGGGGGGTGKTFTESGTTVRAGGGGGAGYSVGVASSDTRVIPSNATVTTVPAENGTHQTGGAGGLAQGVAGVVIISAQGTDGGDLGQAGTPDPVGGVNGGAAGKAIDLNGFTITYIETGTILGVVS